MDLVAIGNRLKEIRGTITQKEIGEEFGVKRSYIGNIEIGRTQPSLEYVMFISSKFNIPIDWILRGENAFNNKDFMKIIMEKLIQNQQEWVLIEAINALSQNKEIEFAFKTFISDQRDVPILRDMIAYLRLIWNGGNADMQVWLKIQFQKSFPDYLEELQKKLYGFIEDSTTKGA